MISCTNCGDYFNQEKTQGILPLDLCGRCQKDMGLIPVEE